MKRGEGMGLALAFFLLPRLFFRGYRTWSSDGERKVWGKQEGKGGLTYWQREFKVWTCHHIAAFVDALTLDAVGRNLAVTPVG